jgi:hypothetical protein
MSVIETETIAYDLSNIGREWCIVGFRERAPDGTERWDYTLPDADRQTFRDGLRTGRIGTVTGRKPDGRLVLYAKTRK